MTDEFVCQPKDINVNNQFYGAFANYAAELSAGWIVRFCQERAQSWAPFSKADIETYYHSRGFYGEFYFNGLDVPWLIATKDGMYHITPTFVAHCLRASPAE